MPSKYEERKNRELQAKEQERRIRRARRTGLNQIVEKVAFFVQYSLMRLFSQNMTKVPGPTSRIQPF